jgi:hypothetical protein
MVATPIYRRLVGGFLDNTRRARAFQHATLLAKLRRNAASDFGRAHGFGAIRSFTEFRRRVPVSSYEHYRGYVERVKRGETTAMFAPGTRVLMFAMTSGTTGGTKFIPVTRDSLREYRRSWLTWGAQAYGDHMDQIHKKSLTLVSNWQHTFTQSKVPCGSISGLTAEMAPSLWRAIPNGVGMIEDAAARHYTTLRIAMADRSVGMIMTANPSTLVELARRANDQRDALIRDIADGTLASDIAVPRKLRERLARTIGRRDPSRARELECIAARHGSLVLREVWPQLSLLGVWTGGSVGIYLPKLEEFYGPTAVRDLGLTASEGRMSIPLTDGTNAGVLDYRGNFYEFIPEEEIDAQEPVTLEAHELEVGRSYFILLTTSGGLYRYDIHDVIRCVGYMGEAPIIEFLNKGAHIANFSGEKLSEHQVVSAVTRGRDQLGLPIEPFTVAPTITERVGYVLLLEPKAHAGRGAELAALVDAHLQALNVEYADKRRSDRLRPLEMLEIPPATWSAFRAARIATRGNLEEYKHPCLVNDLQFVERLTGVHLARSSTHAEGA